ncbi:MAG: HlyD family efflux transporter periplasmic adaptor subunit [Deltaproteobacteria bacterium]|nr:MAG: HlyD family efflux transporter periplasmic adaptor subunit [Deltaproteobacteria bacterium]
MKDTSRCMFLVFLLTPLFVLLAVDTFAQDTPDSSVQDGVFVAKPAMRQVRLIGYTRARRILDIVSEESGRCIKVTADVGDRIAKDGLFAVLDTTFIDLAIKKNQVNQKRLQNLITFYGKDVKRFQELVESETAAQSKLDNIQNKMDQAQFEIQNLKVEEAELRERRARHLIKVPEGWTVTERAVEPGEWVSVGKHLGKAGDFRTLLVPFSLSPEEYNTLKKQNGTVELFFPDENEVGRKLEASVERVSLAFDPETRKINIDLAVREGLSDQRGGLRAELTLMIPDPSGAVLVPASAVLERYEEFWLTRANGERIRVVFLGNGPQGTSRVRGEEVRPGDKFKVKAEE